MICTVFLKLPYIYIKIWIVVYYKGRRFPQETVILLVWRFVAATKIWISDELDQCHITHTLYFITPNFLPNCRMIIAALAIFQAWITVRVGIGKFLFDILVTKSECSGCMLASGWLAVTLRSGNGLIIIIGWNGHVEKLELNDTKKLHLYRDCDLIDEA